MDIPQIVDLEQIGRIVARQKNRQLNIASLLA
jgi:hypothetical protein